MSYNVVYALILYASISGTYNVCMTYVHEGGDDDTLDRVLTVRVCVCVVLRVVPTLLSRSESRVFVL